MSRPVPPGTHRPASSPGPQESPGADTHAQTDPNEDGGSQAQYPGDRASQAQYPGDRASQAQYPGDGGPQAHLVAGTEVRIHFLADTGVLVDLPRADLVRQLAGTVRELARIAAPTDRAGGSGGGWEDGSQGVAAGDVGGRAWAGVTDVVHTLGSLAVLVDPDLGDVRALAQALDGLLDTVLPTRASLGGTAHLDARLGTEAPERSCVEIPVRFDGPDLLEVAASARLSVEAVIAMMVDASYRVAFVGFSPGFAYLVGLPPPLAAIGRRATPRPVVPAGSVAVAGGFAGVYPQPSPGGWQLVGSTSAVLFDASTPPYAALAAGQAVRFVVHARRARTGALALPFAGGSAAPSAPDAPAAGSVATPASSTPAHGAPGRASTANLAPRRREPLRRTPFVSPGRRVVVVEEPGPATTVQDAGRPNVAAIGVPRAGAADELARCLANRLVGNADGDAVLEATWRGPRLRFEVATFVAVVGDVPLTVDGRPVPVGAPIPIAAGQVVAMGANRRGCRSVLAVAGGLRAPLVMGSVSSDLLCGLGPGPLQAGDQLELGTPGRPAGQLRLALHGAHCLAAWAGLTGVCSGPQLHHQDPVVRVVPGPDATRATLDQLGTGRFEVLPDSNRVGVRLGGALVGEPVPDLSSTSRPVTSGVVQLPPDGRPIVLLCDHATVGGYRVIATVASADLPVVAQLRPGAVLGFAVVDPAAAIEARHQVRDALAREIVGRFPTQAG